MSKQVIAVFGGTGLQGGGVVNALLERGKFAVRVLTRNKGSDASKALAARGVELVQGDLHEPGSLKPLFAGAHGAFLVTNFWDPATGLGEHVLGKAAVAAARAAGVDHFIWSTLPNTKKVTGGKLGVHHFTNKALVDDEVRAAGFAHHTFVQAPFYFQNLLGMMAPTPLPGGGKGWAVPMNPSKKCIHIGDITQLGKVVAAAFEQPELVGQGQYLSVASELTSWDEIVATLNQQGNDVKVVQVRAEAYDSFFPGAPEMREMYQWFEGYTYFGPDAEANRSLTARIYDGKLTPFSTWSAANMRAR